MQTDRIAIHLTSAFHLRKRNWLKRFASAGTHCQGGRPLRVKRNTTLAVSFSKTSTALLFKSLAGGRSATKQVPRQLFDAPRPVVQAFLDAYLRGDGHRYANEKVCATTVSRQLAHGIAFLALKLGFLPSIYDQPRAESGIIQGRSIKQAPHQYSVVWYEEPPAFRKVIETDNFYLVPSAPSPPPSTMATYSTWKSRRSTTIWPAFSWSRTAETGLQ